jgi:hypothetical protein
MLMEVVMDSKAWKSLVLAPLLIGALAGCGNDKKKSPEPTSPYAGIWGSAAGLSLYRANLAGKRQDFVRFCDK